MTPVAVRTRAACCHLSLYTGLGLLWLPLVVGLFADEKDDFEFFHRRGAVVYQLVGLFIFGALAVAAPLFSFGSDPFSQGASRGFFWIFYLCLLGVYSLGPSVFAYQAWSGLEYDFAPLNRLVYGRLSTE